MCVNYIFGCFEKKRSNDVIDSSTSPYDNVSVLQRGHVVKLLYCHVDSAS